MAVAVGPSWAATFDVDSLALDLADINPGDGKCEWSTIPPVGQRCTLRAAIVEANALPGADTIRLPGGATIVLTRVGRGEDDGFLGDLDLKGSLTILRNPGTPGPRPRIDGASLDRVFDVRPGASVTISGIEITGGAALTATGGSSGGAVRVEPGASATLSDCRLFANRANAGGAINNWGSLTVTDCTLHGNTVQDGDFPYGNGSSILNSAGALTLQRSLVAANRSAFASGAKASAAVSFSGLTVINSTVTLNDGYGIESVNGTLIIQNSTLFQNTLKGVSYYLDETPSFDFLRIQNSIIAGHSETDCSVSTTGFAPDVAGNRNLDSDNSCGLSAPPADLPSTDPMLWPLLLSNGGPTATYMPKVGSPVIDKGRNDLCAAVDQRGAPRPLDGDVLVFLPEAVCDIGAVEVLPCDLVDPTWQISNMPLGSGETVACFEIAAGPNVQVQSFAVHAFRSRDSVVLENGFTVEANASFTVLRDPEAGSSVGLP